MTDNSAIKIYVNKIENRIILTLKQCIISSQLLTPETMKLLGSTRNMITRKENGENVPHLEVIKFV